VRSSPARPSPLRYLADLSALVRLHHDDVRAGIEPLVMAGRVATCGPVILELLSRARRPADHAALAEEVASLPRVPVDDTVIDRAIEVQALLARAGRHRAVGVRELVVAATAERTGLVLLHHDRAFDLIAEATAQPTEWVAPPGTLG
jgi:predicted nucleic acid-binding protein